MIMISLIIDVITPRNIVGDGKVPVWNPRALRWRELTLRDGVDSEIRIRGAFSVPGIKIKTSQVLDLIFSGNC